MRRVPFKRYIGVVVVLLLLVVLGISSCSKGKDGEKTEKKQGVKKLNVVATTGIVADVVNNIGGDKIELFVLIPAGADPHTFQPRPADYSKMIEADVVFINGAGLEEFMSKSMKEMVRKVSVVSLSDGLKLKMSLSKKGEPNPHVWFYPQNIEAWAMRIAESLKQLDPSNSDYYDKNMKSYVASLESLDKWIRNEVGEIPRDRRKLITDHYFFDYFADNYGFDVVGAIFRSHTTAAQPSAKDISELVDSVKRNNVRVILIGKYSNRKVADEIAKESGAVVVPIYTGTFDKEGGDVNNYIDLMRYDVRMIVEHLKD